MTTNGYSPDSPFTGSFPVKQPEIKNAPVAGQPPAINTPIATPTQTPEKPTQTPTQTPVQTPVQEPVQAPTQPTQTEVKPTPAPTKTAQPIDFNTSAGRESDITKHINDFYAQGVTDATQIRNMSGYATADAGKKAIIDGIINAKVAPSKDNLLDQMMMGNVQQNKGSPDYVNAHNQYSKLQPYLNTSDPSTIVNASQNGVLNSDDLAKIQKYAPGVYQAYQKKKESMANANSINSSVGLTGGKTVDEQFAQAWQNVSNTAMKGTPDDLATAFAQHVSQNPAVLKTIDEVNQYRTEVSNNNAQIANIETEIRKNYPGLNEGAIQALIQSRTKDMRYKMAIDQGNLDNALQYANQVMTLQKGEYDAYQTQYANNFGLAKDVLDTAMGQKGQEFTANLGLQNTQAQFEQSIKQSIQKANDPMLATKNLVDTYAQMGVNPTRSVQELQDQVKMDMASGMTLGQALSRLNTQFQSKPEYTKYMQVNLLGKMTEQQKFQTLSAEQKASLQMQAMQLQAAGWKGDIYSGFINPVTGQHLGGMYGDLTGTGATTTGTSSGITSAADFTKSKEGFRSNAYYDVNGWAIGYGQHSINGVPVKPTDTIDEATATADLNNRIKSAKFNSLVTVPLSEPQKAALYSLEHNVGSGVWSFPNGKKIIDQINSGDFQGASNTLASSGIGTTNAATHEVMPGLVSRRAEEAKLLLDNGKPQTTSTASTTAPATPQQTLFARWQNASGNQKNAIANALSGMGVNPAYLTSVEAADKFFTKTDQTAFQHLNEAEEAVNKLPDASNKITAGLLNKTLDFFGNPEYAQALTAAGLAGDEISKFYGAMTAGDREGAARLLEGKPKTSIIAALEQMKLMAATKAVSQNQVYKQALGADHPVFKNIQDTINKKNQDMYKLGTSEVATPTETSMTVSPELNTDWQDFLKRNGQ